MNDTSALSPLDGRYAGQVEAFARSFSEEALFRQRLPWKSSGFCAGGRTGAGRVTPVAPEVAATLKTWVATFGSEDVARVKLIERRINHDVKAVEYFLKENSLPSG